MGKHRLDFVIDIDHRVKRRVQGTEVLRRQQDPGYDGGVHVQLPAATGAVGAGAGAVTALTDAAMTATWAATDCRVLVAL